MQICCVSPEIGYRFCPFGLESGMVFGGTMGVYGRIYPFNSKLARKKEKYPILNRF